LKNYVSYIHFEIAILTILCFFEIRRWTHRYLFILFFISSVVATHQIFHKLEKIVEKQTMKYDVFNTNRFIHSKWKNINRSVILFLILWMITLFLYNKIIYIHYDDKVNNLILNKCLDYYKIILKCLYTCFFFSFAWVIFNYPRERVILNFIITQFYNGYHHFNY